MSRNEGTAKLTKKRLAPLRSIESKSVDEALVPRNPNLY